MSAQIEQGAEIGSCEPSQQHEIDDRVILAQEKLFCASYKTLNAVFFSAFPATFIDPSDY
jgi:hypothetical protein